MAKNNNSAIYYLCWKNISFSTFYFILTLGLTFWILLLFCTSSCDSNLFLQNFTFNFFWIYFCLKALKSETSIHTYVQKSIPWLIATYFLHLKIFWVLLLFKRLCKQTLQFIHTKFYPMLIATYFLQTNKNP